MTKDKNCIFCKIINKEIPAKILFENDNLLILQDLHPSAPFHHLIIPKEHIVSIASLEEKDRDIMADLFFAARDHALKNNLKGYKININVGRDGGQIIDHLHLHLLSGIFYSK